MCDHAKQPWPSKTSLFSGAANTPKKPWTRQTVKGLVKALACCCTGSSHNERECLWHPDGHPTGGEPTSGRTAAHTSRSSGSAASALSDRPPSSISSPSSAPPPAAGSSRGRPSAPSSCGPRSRATGGPPGGRSNDLTTRPRRRPVRARLTSVFWGGIMQRAPCWQSVVAACRQRG